MSHTVLNTRPNAQACPNGYVQSGIRGSRLIKMLVAAAVVGLLASIAIPAYLDHVHRSARAEVKAILLENAQFLEQNFSEANHYHRTPDGAAIRLLYPQSPTDGTAHYNITLSVDASTFNLTATPVTGGTMDGDACGAYTLNHLGQRGVSGASLSTGQCWKQ